MENPNILLVAYNVSLDTLLTISLDIMSVMPSMFNGFGRWPIYDSTSTSTIIQS